MNANMVYSVVKNGESGKSYVLAKNRLPELEKLFPQQAFDVVQEMTGAFISCSIYSLCV